MPRRKRPRSHDTKFYKYYGCCGACVPDNIQQLFVDSSVRHLCEALCSDQKFLSQAHLPIGLESIGKFAFRGCEQLKTISIPFTVETIGEAAFWACSWLSEVNLSEGLCEIRTGAFMQCFRLYKIKIPTTVIVIEASAFHGCAMLKIVDLQEGLQEIENNAFYDCICLESIKIPRTVVKILDHSFERCQNLRDVKFSDVGLKELGDFVFLDCTSLTRIRLPDSLQSIGSYCFQDCVSLVTVQIEYGVKADFGNGVFHGCRKLTNISLDENESSISACCFTECEYLLEHYGEEENLVDALKDRFRNFSVHNACYRENETCPIDLHDVLDFSDPNYEYENTDDSDDGSSESTTTSTKDADFEDTMDEFGRTPFHILASSAPNDKIDLMETLLARYPSYMLSWKDKYGRYAVDYLPQGDDKSWDAWYELMLQKWMVQRLFKWGKDHWISELASLVHATVHDDRLNLATAQHVLERYETEEMTALLELWLWRMHILVVRKKLFFSREKVDRQNCRSHSGASFIIPTVMEFLGVDKSKLYKSYCEDSDSDDENEDEDSSYDNEGYYYYHNHYYHNESDDYDY